MISSVINNRCFHWECTNPAKRIITEEALVGAAVELLRENGPEGVNARSIAKTLGCSTQPIFHTFGGMEALIAAMYQAVHEMHASYVREYIQRGKYPLYMAYAYGFDVQWQQTMLVSGTTTVDYEADSFKIMVVKENGLYKIALLIDDIEARTEVYANMTKQ